MNGTFHKPGGPIFLILGGEAAADPIWLLEGAWIQYAQMYNALLVMLEHRYYGESQPLPYVYFSSWQRLFTCASLKDHGFTYIYSQKWSPCFNGRYSMS